VRARGSMAPVGWDTGVGLAVGAVARGTVIRIGRIAVAGCMDMRVMDMSAMDTSPTDQLDTVSLDMASARRRQCMDPSTVVVSMAVADSTEVVANIVNLGQGETSRQQQAAGFFPVGRACSTA
jgi:hypothetical protein